MGQLKSQVNEVLELWCVGNSFARIASVTGLTPEMVEFVINQYGEDLMEA